MSSAESSKEIQRLGNTKQVSPARKWCFTYNNYEESDVECIQKILSKNDIYVVGREVGACGTPHLQGYIHFKIKCRPMSIFKHDKMHWEKCKGSEAQNIAYCSKEGNFVTNIPELVPFIVKVEKMWGWQLNVIKIIEAIADARKIYWFWEPTGKMGKSALCKYLCVRHGALMVCGSAKDMKCGIQKWMENNKGREPKIILIDLPRSIDTDYISYSGLEEIKNGCFFSPKFEGGMCLYNPPHVIVFANERPVEDKLSSDRWEIERVKFIPDNDIFFSPENSEDEETRNDNIYR